MPLSFEQLQKMIAEQLPDLDESNNSERGSNFYPVKLSPSDSIHFRIVPDANGDWLGSAKHWSKWAVGANGQPVEPREYPQKKLILRGLITQVNKQQKKNKPEYELSNKVGQVVYLSFWDVAAAKALNDLYYGLDQSRADLQEDNPKATIPDPFDPEEGYDIMIEQGDKGVVTFSYVSKLRKETKGVVDPEILATDDRTMEEFCENMTKASLDNLEKYKTEKAHKQVEDIEDAKEHGSTLTERVAAKRSKEAIIEETEK